MNNKIVIYKSKNKSVILILVSVLLAGSGWLLLQYMDKNVVGWSLVILSVLGLLFGVGTWFDRKPYIILTENGITELSYIRQEIEWSAICRAEEFYFRGQYFICLLVGKDYKPDLVQPAWFYRFDRLYKVEGVKPIFMRMGFFEVNSIKLARMINKMVRADSEKRIGLLNKPVKDW